MFTKSSSWLSVQFPPPADHLNGTERQPLLILPRNGVLCRCCLPPWDYIAGCYSVGMWCDAICIQRKAPVWSTRNGIQVFHIGIDPFRAGGERRETSTLKWVYLRLFADQKNLVQDANGWDLSVWIKSARQLCYWAPFTDRKFKETSSPKQFFLNWSASHLIKEGAFFSVFTIRRASIFSLSLTPRLQLIFD